MDSKEHKTAPTPEDFDIADKLIERCELQDIADQEIDWMGHQGTVRYGLALCHEQIESQGFISGETREQIEKSFKVFGTLIRNVIEAQDSSKA